MTTKTDTEFVEAWEQFIKSPQITDSIELLRWAERAVRRLEAANARIAILEQDNAALEVENTQWQVGAGTKSRDKYLLDALALKVRMLLKTIQRRYALTRDDPDIAKFRAELDINVPERTVRVI